MTKILLAQLDLEIDAIVKRLWPDSRVEANFSPVLDVDFGDVGSDVAIRLAENLRRKPDEIAAQICKEWTLPNHIKCDVINGYINIRFVNEFRTSFEPEPYYNFCKGSLAVVVVPFSKSTSRLAAFRICCAALCQSLIARQVGIEARVILGAETFEIGDSVVDVLRRVLERLISSPTHALESSFSGNAAIEACASSSNVALWIAPHALPRDAFVNFCHSIEGGNRRLRVVGPAAPWLDFRFHVEKIEDFTGWDDEQLLSLLWYLSGSAVAADVDFSIARSAERANISWFWNSTCERCTRLVRRNGSKPSNTGTANELSPAMRRLAVRACYLRTFYLQAAVDGKLQNFMAALADTLTIFNRIFNDPGFRIRQADAKLSAPEIEIIAGAHESLSDSITLCDISKGKRYGSHARTPHKANRTIPSDYE